MWDKDGNYIEQESDVKSRKARKERYAFVERLKKFIVDNDLFGSPHQYGLAIRREDVSRMEAKLKKLDIKYKLDYTPYWHVKVLISNSQIP